MRPLTASELLRAWERGLEQGTVDRALSLLAAAEPETPLEDLAQLSVGQRDARLLTLRAWTFGSSVVAHARCPGCAERLEAAFDIEDIRSEAPTEPSCSSIAVGGYQVHFRLPNSVDLALLSDGVDAHEGRRTLLARCLVGARSGGQDVSADELPETVEAEVIEAMAEADRQADVTVELSCPACGHRWAGVFDVLSFFWSEVDAWARRLLREVHSLASRYSWREADIVAMTPRRRQLYLEMAGV